MSRLFLSGGQSTGGSASVLPVNIQGQFPLGLTGLISLQSKGLSRVFCNTTIQKHQFFESLLSSQTLTSIHDITVTTLTSIHDHWKNHTLTRWNFVGKVISLLFNMLSRLVITFLPKSQFSCSIVSDSLRPHKSQHARPPCSSPTPTAYQTHVHPVGDAIQPSHPLLSPSPPASVFPSIKIFSSESVLHVRWPKC